jgi:hypothetical protein
LYCVSIVVLLQLLLSCIAFEGIKCERWFLVCITYITRWQTVGQYLGHESFSRGC